MAAARVLAFNLQEFGDTTSIGGPVVASSSATGEVVNAASLTTPSGGGSVAPVLERQTQMLPIQSLPNGLVLVFPLLAVVEQQDGEWTALSTDLALVGRGESDFEALDDLRDLIAELYDDLSDAREALGKHLQNQLAFLERLAGLRN